MHEDFYLSLFLIGGKISKIKLGLQTYLIGRNKYLNSYLQKGFICLNYSFISRAHSSLVMHTDEVENCYYYTIWDGIPLERKSRSGVFVNGKKINWTRLQSGDIITFAEPESEDSIPRLVFTIEDIPLCGEEETVAHEIGDDA